MTVHRIFRKHSLDIFDVEEIPTHGGSLRIYLKHHIDKTRGIAPAVTAMIKKEQRLNLNDLASYDNFQHRVNDIKYCFLNFLLKQKKTGKTIAGYGAAAKGNTLLNFFGIAKDLIAFVADRSPHKQGLFLPGSHIPIVPEEEIKIQKPEYIVIFPWNIAEEIMGQLSYIRRWGGKFVIAIPKLKII